MLYELLYGLKDTWSGFNVFRYITVRAGCAVFTSLVLSLLLGPWLIRKLRHLCHPTLLDFREHKNATPTMGGFLILGSMLFSVLLWANLANPYILMLIAVTVWLAAFGIWDDYLKLKHKDPKGLRPRIKIIGQAGVGFIIGCILYYHPALDFNTSVWLPFFKNIAIPLGSYYILFVTFIIVATSNAVNLTDGMDGLAIGSILMAAIAYGIIAYVAGNVPFSKYLSVVFVRGAGEVTVFCSALVGACFGFLWYNCYPAEIFMGDTGSLPLGGIIGMLAIIVKQEVSLLFVGGIFVLEAASVVIQVVSFRTRKKRVFLMTPVHHHFELKGWSETKVVVRFWILAMLFALFTLMTLKIR